MPDARKKAWTKITGDSVFDAVVIGGGVNGIGVYRELALQGLRVLLVERNDFCSGCSAAPSRMIHGGLRYLENGEFDLVKESLRERDALLQNAPHMVRALPTVIPITSHFSGLWNAAVGFFGGGGQPSNRGALPIKLGLTFYDWITRKRRALPKHRFLGQAETRKTWPELTREAKLSAVFYDAWISHPERLCLEMIRDVEKLAPECIALNYAEMQVDHGAFHVVDNRTGQSTKVTPRTVIHATGAWLDSTLKELESSPPHQMVSGTKGSHLILKNDQLLDALHGHMVYFENKDGRICIALPYQGTVLAGSTDIRVNDTTRVKCEPDEEKYILDSLLAVCPDVAVSRDDIVYSFSGIRPLPKSDQDFTGRISRGHYLRKVGGDVPQYCMVGGKWTTFRAFAEQTTDTVLTELGRPRVASTLDMAIGGGKDFDDCGRKMPSHLRQRFGIGSSRAAHLIDRYGSGAESVLEFCQTTEDSALAPDTEHTTGEIAYLIRTEHVETLSDIVLRRTDLAISGGVSSDIIDSIAAVLGREKGLSADTLAEQRDTLIEELETFHGVAAETLIRRSKERSKECA